jgi:hypothetical protein
MFKISNAAVGSAATSISTNQQALQLLSALWRSQDRTHFICTLDKATAKFRNVSVTSPDEAVSFALAYSAMGLDTYFAGAEFASPDSRTTPNTLGAWAFFVDIDVGPDKAGTGRGYASIEEALAALIEFCKKVGLPEPTMLVNSGAGLHAYWSFDAFLERAQWLDYAGKFKALMKACGFRADPSRTADIASVLRVPGTLNFKYSPPRPVTLISYKQGHVELTVMLDAIDAAMVSFAVDPDAIAAPVVLASVAMAPVPLQAAPDREPPNLLTLASALKVLPPDCDEKSWKFYRIGPMAYEARYFPELHGALYKLARDWSSGELGGIPSVKWNSPGGNGQSGKQCFDRVWRRFITDNYTGKRPSLGTIYFHAKEAGWSFYGDSSVTASATDFGDL